MSGKNGGMGWIFERRWRFPRQSPWKCPGGKGCTNRVLWFDIYCDQRYGVARTCEYPCIWQRKGSLKVWEMTYDIRNTNHHCEYKLQASNTNNTIRKSGWKLPIYFIKYHPYSIKIRTLDSGYSFEINTHVLEVDLKGGGQTVVGGDRFVATTESRFWNEQ